MFGLSSETLSGIAIIISILGTIVSVFYTNITVVYTKKQFEAGFYPRIVVQVLERSCGGSGLKTCLSIKLRNLSPDRGANNVRIQASLSHPILHWRLWTIKWYQFFEKGNLNIRPEETKETLPISQGQHSKSLEGFLLKSFPQLVYPEADPNTPEEVAFKKPVAFLLRVRITYQPPIMNAKDIKQDFYYMLTPHFRRNKGHPYCLNFWVIKAIKV